jgi:hypothetical protein
LLGGAPCLLPTSSGKEQHVSSSYDSRSQPEVSGWAIGGITFAAVMMIVIGAMQILDGIAAINTDNLFVVTRNYTFGTDLTTWGWVHVGVGVLILLAGICLIMGQTWAALVALVVVMVSAILNFLTLPYYPFWAAAIIALDAWVIWALTRPGVIGGTQEA